MLHVLARRSALAATAAAVAVHNDKLSIYPAPTPEVILVETPSELEKQIRAARLAVTARYLEAHARVQDVVSRWIGVEQAVENRVKSLVAPDEPVTPGLLYVGVATLTGSVFARNRGLLARAFLPPALLVLSLNHFLPKTAHNLAQYLGSLEDAYLPALAAKHEIANQHTAMTWERIKDSAAGARDGLADGVTAAIGRAEDATGLKLKETLGWGRGVAAAVEKQTKEAAHVVAEKTEVAAGAVEKTAAAAVKAVEETAAAAVKAVEKKTEAVTASVAHKAAEEQEPVVEKKPEAPKRLV